MKNLCTLLIVVCSTLNLFAQEWTTVVTDTASNANTASPNKKTLNGIASYYADKFVGKQTANGEIYSHKKLTAACNRLPLGTWIKVTNLRNQKTVIVKVNDRLHPKNSRVVDLSRTAAERLGFIKRGLTQVKVEVLGKIKTPGT